MTNCSVCGSIKFREEKINELFQIEGQPVLVEHIPARVCARCGEAVFSRETTEHIRRIVHGEAKPLRTMQLNVFSFA